MTDKFGTWIPRNLHLNMISNGHNMSEIFLVSSVYSYEKNSQTFFASNVYVSQFLGITPRRARQVITNLVEAGWIKRDLKKSHRGSERQIRTTSKTKKAISIPPSKEEYNLPERKKSSSNSKDDNTEYNKDLTSTSKQNEFVSDEALRCLISKDINIDKNHRAFKYYEAAHRWSLLRSNLNIPKNPNTTIIEALLRDDAALDGGVSDFIYFLDGRWQERNVSQREEPVNLSWLILSNCEDERMKDYILETEGDAPLTLISINEMLKEY